MTNYELLSYVQTQLEENPVLEAAQPPQPIPNSLSRFAPPRSSRELNYDGDKDMFSWLPDSAGDETLLDNLHEQLLCSSYSEKQVALTKYLARCLDENGYLDESCEDIAKRLSLPSSDIHEAHNILRSLSPAGIGAKDLVDCLILQLNRHDNPPPYSFEIISLHLQDVAEHKYKNIAQSLGTTLSVVYSAVSFIKSLNPKPAAHFTNGDKSNYIIPDAVVINTPTGLDVLINDRWIPTLRISSYYKSLLPDCDDNVKNYLAENFEKARMVIRSIDQRKTTLIQCIKAILESQSEFFIGNQKCLVSLSQANLAAKLSISESTLSRAINGKYLLCSSGIYPLSFFFSRSNYGTDHEAFSQNQISSKIAAIIEAENPSSPLSDQAISNRLKSEGIDIARRTVAKYRTDMQILSASERKAQHLFEQHK